MLSRRGSPAAFLGELGALPIYIIILEIIKSKRKYGLSLTIDDRTRCGTERERERLPPACKTGVETDVWSPCRWARVLLQVGSSLRVGCPLPIPFRPQGGLWGRTVPSGSDQQWVQGHMYERPGRCRSGGPIAMTGREPLRRSAGSAGKEAAPGCSSAPPGTSPGQSAAPVSGCRAGGANWSALSPACSRAVTQRWACYRSVVSRGGM